MLHASASFSPGGWRKEKGQRGHKMSGYSFLVTAVHVACFSEF